MDKSKIALGSDHAGFEMKKEIIQYLNSSGYMVSDFGTHSAVSMDYPDVAHPLSLSVEKGEHAYGILLCGSGNGVAITANKHAGIRAAICWLPELAALARQHNDANILVLPARFINESEAIEIIRSFLTSSFEGGRHAARVGKISI